MKKSPLSTPGGQGGNFYRGRGRQRGYGYNQMKNSNDDYQRFPYPHNDGNKHFDCSMVPFETGSPNMFHHNNRGHKRQSNDRCSQRFSNSGVSGSYNQSSPSNHRNNFQTNHGSPFSPQKFQRNQQNRMRNDYYSHRKMPISEFIDLRSMFEDPWAELMSNLEVKKNAQTSKIVTNDSSIEILYEKDSLEDSSLTSISDEATINISSSYEVNEGSSVDLPLESINFGQESKDSSILSSSITSGNASLSEKADRSQDDSVVILS